MHYIINTTLHYQHCIILSMLNWIINSALYHQDCIISSTLHYIINTALHQTVLYHLHCITSSKLHYTINTALDHQDCITSSTLHYIIKAVLHHQERITSSKLHYINNTALYHQDCTASSRLHYIIKTALHHQNCITSSTLHCIIWAVINDVWHHQRFHALYRGIILSMLNSHNENLSTRILSTTNSINLLWPFYLIEYLIGFQCCFALPFYYTVFTHVMFSNIRDSHFLFIHTLNFHFSKYRKTNSND